METNSNMTNANENEQMFSIRDFLVLCLSKWQWFVCSLIICIGLGYFYSAKQEPVFRRTVSVLIKDEKSKPGGDMTAAFSNLGLFGGNTNVQNELISLMSPAVMAEVVVRLDLTMSYIQEGKVHPITLYKDNNPVSVSMPDLDPQAYAGFSMELRPDNSVRVFDMWDYDASGKLREYDDQLNTRLTFNFIKSPIGRLGINPNGGFLGKITEPVVIRVAHSGRQATIESYAARLKGDLANQDSDVIDLTIDDTSVQRANDILNSVIVVYNEFWVEDKNKLAIATTGFITERLNVIEKELGHVDDEISDFKSANKVPDIESTLKVKLEEASNVNVTAVKTRNQLAMSQYLRDFIKNPQNTFNIIPVNIGLENTAVAPAVTEYNNILLARENLLANSGPDNPVVKEYERRLSGLRESIYSSINANIGQLEASLKDMERTQGNNDSQLAAAPVQAKYLLSIERQQKVKEELYVFLLQKREENELSQTFTAYNTRIITPPFGPLAPVAPKKTLILAIAIILALAIPGVIFYVIEVTNTKVRSRVDLENVIPPFAGEIPLIDRKKWWQRLLRSRKARKTEKDVPKPVVAEGKRDIPNEAFRVVRSNIDFMIGRNGGCAVMMLTSFNPGSGKSFIAYNLGASFALKHKRVLVIDGDLRHGSISEYAGKQKKGLSNYLTESTEDWHSLVVHNVGVNNLDIMPIGHRPPNPAELLDNGRLGRLISDARDEYDVILVDCPPVNIVVDTQIVEEYVDRTIFVVRAGLLDRSAIPEINELYNEDKFKHMCILLNGTDTTFSSYYQYGNYQSYDADE